MRNIVRKLIFTALFLAVLGLGIAEAISKDVSDAVVRLHVIAHSNDAFDQNVKYKVRDALLEYVNETYGGDAFTLFRAKEQKETLTDIANEVLLSEGVPYRARIETGRFFFPTKSYQNLTFPKGEYDAVRVILGDGNGENWWCVMYPPLCFTESAKGAVSEEYKEAFQESLHPLTYRTISGDTVTIKPALRAVELWQTAKQKFEKRFLRGERR